MMESKHQRRHHLNNKGYSLVELIIVIGIIVVMTGIATVTVTLINSAKAKEAAVTFSSELADLQTKSKGQIISLTDVATGVTTTYPNYTFAIRLYKDGSKCYIQKGYCDETNAFTAFTDTNVNSGKGISLSSRIIIKYTNTDTSTQIEIDDSGNEVIIAYDKNGRCVSGSGVYDFYKKNGNLVDTVTIKKNGSYQNK